MNIVTDFYSLPFLLVAVTTASICDVGLEECFLCTVRLLELHTLPNELLSTLIRQLPYAQYSKRSARGGEHSASPIHTG